MTRKLRNVGGENGPPHRKAVAFVWSNLLTDAFDSVEPFMSKADIGAGERNLDKIATKLAHTSFGIVIVTQQNEHTPWINFEAGALSKNFDDDAVRSRLH